MEIYEFNFLLTTETQRNFARAIVARLKGKLLKTKHDVCGRERVQTHAIYGQACFYDI